jgi:DNA mismatch repair protein MutL
VGRRRPIAVLPPTVAERIAAGEVIERPAAVVRELLDNALDAAATAITIDLTGGGLTQIRVSDDGEGIPADEVALAFAHHATSKIAGLPDLSALQTLGFRGEALPSIAAVAEVELHSRTADAPIGMAVGVRAGVVLWQRPVARQRGTTVTVRQLFFNVPARRKFLAEGRPETLQVGQLVRRYALAHPDRRLALTLDGRLSFRAEGRGTVADAIVEVYGTAVAKTLLPLPTTTRDGVTVGGWLSGRSVTRPRRDQVTLIVNGRWVQGRALLPALEAAYRPLLPRGRHPIAVLRIDLPPEQVDPNVHPTKAEVRLLPEAAVASTLAELVRETLARAPVRPTDDALTLAGEQFPLLWPARQLRETPDAWTVGASEPASPFPWAELRVLGQVQQSLILTEGPDGLLLVDQHRAHERILYEQLARRGADGSPAQTLLEPLVVELSPHQASRLAERQAELASLGLVGERLGGHSFLVRAIPFLGESAALTEPWAMALADAATAEDGWRDRLLVALACRSAVRRGQRLEPWRLAELLRGLATTAAPAVCPHGSPLILHLSRRFLERQFEW